MVRSPLNAGTLTLLCVLGTDINVNDMFSPTLSRATQHGPSQHPKTLQLSVMQSQDRRRNFLSKEPLQAQNIENFYEPQFTGDMDLPDFYCETNLKPLLTHGKKLPVITPPRQRAEFHARDRRTGETKLFRVPLQDFKKEVARRNWKYLESVLKKAKLRRQDMDDSDRTTPSVQSDCLNACDDTAAEDGTDCCESSGLEAAEESNIQRFTKVGGGKDKAVSAVRKHGRLRLSSPDPFERKRGPKLSYPMVKHFKEGALLRAPNPHFKNFRNQRTSGGADDLLKKKKRDLGPGSRGFDAPYPHTTVPQTMTLEQFRTRLSHLKAEYEGLFSKKELDEFAHREGLLSVRGIHFCLKFLDNLMKELGRDFRLGQLNPMQQQGLQQTWAAIAKKVAAAGGGKLRSRQRVLGSGLGCVEEIPLVQKKVKRQDGPRNINALRK